MLPRGRLAIEQTQKLCFAKGKKNDEHPGGVRERHTTHTFIKINALFICNSTQGDALCLN